MENCLVTLSNTTLLNYFLASSAHTFEPYRTLYHILVNDFKYV